MWLNKLSCSERPWERRCHRAGHPTPWTLLHTQSAKQSVSQPVSQPVRAVRQSVSQSMSQWGSQSVSEAVNESSRGSEATHQEARDKVHTLPPPPCITHSPEQPDPGEPRVPVHRELRHVLEVHAPAHHDGDDDDDGWWMTERQTLRQWRSDRVLTKQ